MQSSIKRLMPGDQLALPRLHKESGNNNSTMRHKAQQAECVLAGIVAHGRAEACSSGSQQQSAQCRQRSSAAHLSSARLERGVALPLPVLAAEAGRLGWRLGALASAAAHTAVPPDESCAAACSLWAAADSGGASGTKWEPEPPEQPDLKGAGVTAAARGAAGAPASRASTRAAALSSDAVRAGCVV